ncbi:MAG: hypothetical protein Q8S13_09885, partial [Dehalococcoidia bacterium]|nr:hypothetical protein [Dehalococcoidia bacterium]
WFQRDADANGVADVCESAVGGIAETADSERTPVDASGSPGANAGLVAGVAAALALGAVALGGAAWYARRRWGRWG